MVAWCGAARCGRGRVCGIFVDWRAAGGRSCDVLIDWRPVSGVYAAILGDIPEVAAFLWL